MSGQSQPSQGLPLTIQYTAIRCSLIPCLSAVVHSRQEWRRQKLCKASDIFSALLCSNAASSKRSKNAFAKSSSAFSHLLLLFLNPFSRFAIDQRPARFLSVRFLLLFFPTNDPTDEPSPFRGRIPAVCFTHFPHICIKFEKLLSTNTKFIPEKSRSLDFPFICKGTCSILNGAPDEPHTEKSKK